MYINKKELNSLQAAIDFISTNADGATDYTPFEEMQDDLRSIWKKAINNSVKKKFAIDKKNYGRAM